MVDFFLTLPGLSSRSDFIKKLSGFLAPRILRRLEVRWKRFVVYALVPNSPYDILSCCAIVALGVKLTIRAFRLIKLRGITSANWFMAVCDGTSRGYK